ncbi:GNAT family N-acetyltransferase [Salinicola halimionae]|uniref:GNAT family N-acetyltransferase n=1 Tax=Salinicola halimionae TaxID=1949081 RepID=UPI000DA1A174|nr:GNAT family N-acetyltransferase [Salinicola halimionae]
MADVRWRPALSSDITVIVHWIETPKALERWAGPGLTWPTDGPTLWQEIAASDNASFSLVVNDTPIAFGQLVDKGERRAHLARIIVSPVHRRQGLGERLCRHLLAEARHRKADTVTLNVFVNNHAALDLYRRLGFVNHGVIDTRGIQPMQLRQFTQNVDNTDP